MFYNKTNIQIVNKLPKKPISTPKSLGNIRENTEKLIDYQIDPSVINMVSDSCKQLYSDTSSLLLKEFVTRK